jgi:DNA polymerase-3 subunit delta'
MTALRLLSTRLCPWLRPAWQRLDDVRATRHLGHAWLLAGPEGVGKINLALAFGARLLDGGGPAPPPLLGPSEAIAAIRDRHTPSDHHPDLHWVFPEEDKRTISVEQVRVVSEALTLKPYRGTAKVVIIEPADGMTAGAANALLKTLEEPSDDTYLLLLSHQPGRLPATIRSRCQRLDVARPPLEEVAAWLGETAEQTARLWPLVGGAPLRIAELLQNDTLVQNKDIVDELNLLSEDNIDPQTIAQHWLEIDTGQVLTWLAGELHRAIRRRLAPAVSTSVTDPAGARLHNAWANLTLRTLFEQHQRAESLASQLGAGLNMELALRAWLLGFQTDRGRS